MTSFLYYYLVIGLEVADRGQTSNSSPMNNFNFSDCRKAVNQATFRPTAERKTEALKLLQEAMDFVTNLEEVKESKPKAKKRRRKTTKRTPSQKVADRQEMASTRTYEVGPIKPSKKAKTASVKEAAKSAKAVSEATGAAAKAAKKSQLKAEAEAAESPKVTAKKPSKKAKVYKPNGQPNQVELDKRFAALDEKLNSMIAVMALHMESMEIPSPANEVSLEEAGIK